MLMSPQNNNKITYETPRQGMLGLKMIQRVPEFPSI
jgi:hypothetical protein